ncbi:MAG: hypothetical protein HY785_19890 [Oscillatoriophycideae cyanobacterium NC_groundwater_1537_Pr4_S-0.65um_50_18]|nr:hypothetical protein [Oscillatoriophycideae cyanobacterium NC_groundwater_1537_Pr4_S-0.65um_50_18]
MNSTDASDQQNSQMERGFIALLSTLSDKTRLLKVSVIGQGFNDLSRLHDAK